jgi:hypothetical protein
MILAQQSLLKMQCKLNWTMIFNIKPFSTQLLLPSLTFAMEQHTLKKCKQLLESQHLLLLKDIYLVVKVIIYI